MANVDRVAMVTGSTSGIGLAIAHSLAKRGVNVIVTGLGDEKLVNSIVNDIKTRYGVRCDYVAGDLRKVSEIESLCKEATRLYPNGIDILINNAGLMFMNPIEEQTTEEWDTTIAVTLSAQFHLIKHCLPDMKRKGYGRIVNLSSVTGLTAIKNATAYVAAKHGVIGLTKAVALEAAAHGITCNAVCPSFVRTHIQDANFEKVCKEMGITEEKLLEQITSSTPTKKLITTEQVAELVEFLCLSSASSQITGSSYVIDNGNTAQ